jgi:hypothetical protein
MAGWLNRLEQVAGKPALVVLFLFCALPVGLMSALVTPPGQSPDEPMHMMRAEGLLHGAILAVRKSDTDPRTGRTEWNTGVKVDVGILHAASGHVTEIENRPVVTEQDFLADRANPPDHRLSFVNIPNTAKYFPVAYVPAALGLAFGLLLHAAPFMCFLLARLGMLAAFLVVGAAALRIAAYGEAALLTILLLPATLFLAGSINQDGLLTAMTCLACAAVTRNAPRFWILGLVLFAFVLGSKPPYALMIGAFALPAFGPGFWRRVRDIAIACAPVAVWVLITAKFVNVPFGYPPYHPGPLFMGDRSVWLDHTDDAANLHILLAQPSRFFTLPWAALQMWWRVEIWMMIGALGFSQLILPYWYCQLWWIAGGAALLGLMICRRPQWVPAGKAWVSFFIVMGLLAATYWLLMVMLYIDWTRVGMDAISGLMGRYSLPLLPFLLFAIPAWRLRFRVPMLLPALPTIVLGLVDIGYVPMKLIWNYYLH